MAEQKEKPSEKNPSNSQDVKLDHKRIQTAEGWQRSVLKRRKRIP